MIVTWISLSMGFLCAGTVDEGVFADRLVETYANMQGLQFNCTFTCDLNNMAAFPISVSDSCDSRKVDSLRYEVSMDSNRFVVREFVGDTITAAMWGKGTVRYEYSRIEDAWTRYDTEDWPVSRRRWPFLLNGQYPRRLADSWVGKREDDRFVAGGLPTLMAMASRPMGELTIEKEKEQQHEDSLYRITMSQPFPGANGEMTGKATMITDLKAGTMAYRRIEFTIEIPDESEGKNAKATLTTLFHDFQINPELSDEDLQFTPPDSAKFIDPDSPRFSRPALLGKPFPEMDLRQVRPAKDKTSSSEAEPSGMRLYMFWATWCSPCKPMLEDVAESMPLFQKAGVEVVAVSIDRNPNLVKQFLHKQNRDWPFEIAHLSPGTYKSKLPHDPVPRMYLVDDEGMVIWELCHQHNLEDLKKRIKSMGTKRQTSDKVVRSE